MTKILFPARRRRGIKLAMVWAVLFAGAGEAGLRFLSWADARWGLSGRAESALVRAFASPSVVEDMRRFSPTLVYRNTPNYRSPHARINSLGYRGDEFDPANPAGLFRVVCLGDSCTFGWFVDDRHAYPAMLQEKLRRNGRRAEVINAGVPGYSSWQTGVWYKEDIRALRPNVIVLYVGWNDIFEASPETGGQRGKGEKIAAYLARQSALATQVRYAFGRMMKPLRKSASENPELYRHYRPNFFIGQMSEILNDASARGITALLVTLPTSDVVDGELTRAQPPYFPETPGKFLALYGAYNGAIRRLAEVHGAGLVDPASFMNGRRELFTDFCHPSAAGNAVIAEALARAIQPIEDRR